MRRLLKYVLVYNLQVYQDIQGHRRSITRITVVDPLWLSIYTLIDGTTLT